MLEGRRFVRVLDGIRRLYTTRDKPNIRIFDNYGRGRVFQLEIIVGNHVIVSGSH